MAKEYKVGDIKKWQGYRNSKTKQIDGGYLWIITEVNGEMVSSKGIRIDGVKNRSEAIKKYLANPENPNNYTFVR